MFESIVIFLLFYVFFKVMFVIEWIKYVVDGGMFKFVN